MWSRPTSLRNAAAAVATLMLSGCVFWSGQYGVTLTPDGKTATLSGYGAADAQAQLDSFVRGYCHGPFSVAQRTASEDGRTHSVTFACGGA